MTGGGCSAYSRSWPRSRSSARGPGSEHVAATVTGGPHAETQTATDRFEALVTNDKTAAITHRAAPPHHAKV